MLTETMIDRSPPRIEPEILNKLKRVKAYKSLKPKVFELNGIDSRTVISKDSFRNEEVYHFDSLFDFISFLDREKDLSTNTGKYPQLFFGGNQLTSDYSIRQVKGAFNSVETFREGLNLAYRGWKEGVKRVANWEAEIMSQFNREVEVPTFFNDFTGGDVDVGAFLRGEPENMLNFMPSNTNARSPRVLVDVSVRCDECGRRAHDYNPTPPDYVMVRGAAISLLIKILTRYGMKPEVIVGTVAFYEEINCTLANKAGSFQMSRSQPKKRTTLVTIHKPGGSLDIDKLVFCLAHDAFVRKLDFRFHEILNLSEFGGIPYYHSQAEVGHTSTFPHIQGRIPLQKAHLPLVKPNFEYEVPITDQDIVVPSFASIKDEDSFTGQENNFDTVQRATEWLLGSLEKEGIKFI